MDGVTSVYFHFEYLFMNRAFRRFFPEIQSDFMEGSLYIMKLDNQKIKKEQYIRLLEFTQKLSGYELQCLDNFINHKRSIKYQGWNNIEKISHYFFHKPNLLNAIASTNFSENNLKKDVNEALEFMSNLVDYNKLNINNLKRIERLTWEIYLIPYFYTKKMISSFPNKTYLILMMNLEVKTGDIFKEIIIKELNASYTEEYYDDYNYSHARQILVCEVLDKIKKMGDNYLKISNNIHSKLDLTTSNRANSGIANRANRWILTSNTKEKVEWITEYFIKNNIIFPVNLNNYKNLSNTEKNNIVISILVYLENYEEFIDNNTKIHKNAKGNIIHLKNIQSAWNNYNAKSPKRHLMSAKSSRRLNELAQLTNKSKEQCLMSAIENEIKFIQKFKYF